MKTIPAVVHAGSLNRPAALVETPLPGCDPTDAAFAEVVFKGVSFPAQIDARGDRIFVRFVMPKMDSGTASRFELRLRAAADGAFEPSGHCVEIVPTQSGVSISFGGDLFTTYHHHAGLARPFFHPVLALGGRSVTRRWPMEEFAPEESHDHHHHKGLWVAHGAANGVDNWSEEEGHGGTLHQEFERLSGGTLVGHLDVRSIWRGPEGRPVLTEFRRMRFFSLPDVSLSGLDTESRIAEQPVRGMDLEVHLRADYGAVTFGDTKEGGICAVRVATSMDASGAGRIENAQGGVGEAQTWGRRSQWCDYSGPVSAQTVGVAILDHPESFMHPTYWHVRDYGLMTANPFGISNFTGDPSQRGDFTLPAGDTLRFRYRVLVHCGDAGKACISGHYTNWIDPPRVALEI